MMSRAYNRSIFFVMVSFFFIILSLFSCESEKSKDVYAEYQEALNKNVNMWSTSQITHYRYTYISYGLALKSNISYVIEVDNDTLVSIFNTADNSYVSTSEYLFFSDVTVSQLFNSIQSAISAKCKDINIVYNEVYGYPSAIHIDWSSSAVDSGTYKEVSNFEKL